VSHPIYTTSKASYHVRVGKNMVDTLVASDYKDPPTVSEEPYYIVRRLMPTECAKLQGFPSWWCKSLETENPGEDEISFWKHVFDTYSKITGKSKSKTEKQIIKWLKNPHSDTAEYKLWGNGVALPCVYFVLSGIVYFCDKK
ncbi:MAG: DNA (cytosine-5-)-methyltransferase, partial [Clostridia bacterium]|nr:DNA (cytosine-5-)-methyltransferase [Clostridia bacterium]